MSNMLLLLLLLLEFCLFHFSMNDFTNDRELNATQEGNMTLNLIDFSDELFRSGRPPRPGDVFIAVMGVTGSGKSTFIAQCSGKSVRIGHSLSACTSQVDVYAYDMTPSQIVYLIDTPGFDDTTRSDAEVLSEIATWLGDSYQNKILLHGIIYLHRITDRRMQGGAWRNLLLFRELCGRHALKKVVLVTTMWDQISLEEGKTREQELLEKPEYWGNMIERGSTAYRHLHTQESAMTIVHRLAQHKEPVATNLQRELVDHGRQLSDTSAGRELQRELLQHREDLLGKCATNENQLRQAINESDSEAKEALVMQRDEYKESFRRVEQNINHLRITVDGLVAERNEKLGERHAAYNNELEVGFKELEVAKAAPAVNLSTVHTSKRHMPTSSLSSRVAERPHPHLPLKKTEEPPRHRVAEQSLAMLEDNPEASVSLWGGVVCVIGKHSINSAEYPRLELTSLKQESAYLRNASLGQAEAGARSWIARYKDTWMTSSNLTNLYPQLAKALDTYGVQQLQSCFLGPNKQFFAKWQQGGHVEYHAMFDFPRVLAGHKHVVDVAFGYEDTFFVVYTTSSFGLLSVNSRPTTYYDLKDHYQNLKYFLNKGGNKDIIVLGITLDPDSKTDYILVYTFKEKIYQTKSNTPLYHVQYHCSEANSDLIQRFYKNPPT